MGFKKGVIYSPDGTVPVGQSFVAYGEASVGRVVGVLIGDDSGRLLAGRTLCEPCDGASTSGVPLWVLCFDYVPGGETYTFSLLEAGGGVLDDVDLEVNGGLIREDTRILSPGSNATVCTNFVASGTADNAGVVTGTMTASGGTVYNGVQVRPGPNWCLKFTGLPAGAGYTLRVSVGGVAAGTPSTNITVQNCQQQ
jgi:hypothetical protein